MNRGKSYPPERKMYKDAVTGANITRLTCFPLTHFKLYFHVNAWTPDGSSLVYQVMNENTRDAGIDIYKINTDGYGMVKLTDDREVAGPVVSPDGRWLYYVCQGTLCRVDMRTCEMCEIANIGNIAMSDALSANTAGSTINASMSPDGAVYYSDCTLKNGLRAILRYQTDGSRAEIIRTLANCTHTQIEPSSANIIATQSSPDPEGKHRNIWLMNNDGTNFRALDLVHGNGHWMWLGGTGRVVSNTTEPCLGICTYAEGDEKQEQIVNDDLMWHAASDRSGEWLISDTNWPDTGLWLINVKTKKRELLCKSNSSNCHPQWTHPHPSFSPDNKYIVYNSDEIGTGQMYLCEIPVKMLERLSK